MSSSKSPKRRLTRRELSSLPAVVPTLEPLVTEVFLEAFNMADSKKFVPVKRSTLQAVCLELIATRVQLALRDGDNAARIKLQSVGQVLIARAVAQTS